MKKLFSLSIFLLLTVALFGQTKETIKAVNLRSTPQYGDNKICRIPKGAVLQLIGGGMRYGNWIAVKYNGTLGYVHIAYLWKRSNLHPIPINSQTSGLSRMYKHERIVGKMNKT